MKPLTAGRVARRLLAFYNNDPKRWTKGWFFEDKTGERLIHYENATCFCASGALRSILKEHGDVGRWHRYVEARGVLSQALGCTVETFNDSCADFNEFKKKLHEIARTP